MKHWVGQDVEVLGIVGVGHANRPPYNSAQPPAFAFGRSKQRKPRNSVVCAATLDKNGREITLTRSKLFNDCTRMPQHPFQVSARNHRRGVETWR